MIYRLPDKQPNETIKGLFVDFDNKFLPGEVVIKASVIGSVNGVIDNVQMTGTKVVWDVTGGTNKDTVKIFVVATGSLGSIRDANLLMAIKEVV